MTPADEAYVILVAAAFRLRIARAPSRGLRQALAAVLEAAARGIDREADVYETDASDARLMAVAHAILGGPID